MGDLKNFVKTVVSGVIKNDYPHLCRPGSQIARVTYAEQDAGEIYSYTLRVLDANENDDYQFPEIPKVKSKEAYRPGDKVVIQYVNGLYPYISGRWYG